MTSREGVVAAVSAAGTVALIWILTSLIGSQAPVVSAPDLDSLSTEVPTLALPPDPDTETAYGPETGIAAPPSAAVAAPSESARPNDGKPAPAPLLPDAAPAGRGPLPTADRITCPAATRVVATSDQLTEALATARPGDVISAAPGSYVGNFVVSASGTASAPIHLCGPETAWLDGGDVDDGYVLHLDGASHWRLVGFTVTNGQKGIVADQSVGSIFQDLTVTTVGDEGIHLRSHSTDNVVLDNTITDTGHRRDKFGEGVYIGSAVSNWCTYTDCQPDRSDRNVVKGNVITAVSAEAIDVKEGTTGGLLVDNTFEGSAITGADSWVDVKGNNYLVSGNVGSNAPEDGFQTHGILPGWGDFNVFTGNRAEVNGPGYAFFSWPIDANVVACDNQFSAAEAGLSNHGCSQGAS